MSTRALLWVGGFLLAIVVSVYGYTLAPAESEGVRLEEGVGIANPAAVHCIRLGGELEIHEDATGAQAGGCRLKDGRVCEEWALFQRGECVGVNS